MRFADLPQYLPKPNQNVFAFVCEDAFLVEESRPIWRNIFGGNWTLEKYTAREFEEISASRLTDEALSRSLFSQGRVLLVANAEKLTKGKVEDIDAVHAIPDSFLKIVMVLANRKSVDGSWRFPVVEIDSMKPPEVARWLVDRYRLAADIARYLVDNVGTDLYQLHTEIEKLQTYVGADRPVQARDVDIIILRSEQFGPFELDDAIVARNYKKAVTVVEAMLEDGVDSLLVLARIVRVWRQLFVVKGLADKKGARDIAMAAAVPAWKAADFVASCRKFEWKQLAEGFRELLYADRAFKTSSASPEVYFDVLLWKLIGTAA
jgi:DNA polymerase III delta subunit